MPWPVRTTVTHHSYFLHQQFTSKLCDVLPKLNISAKEKIRLAIDSLMKLEKRWQSLCFSCVLESCKSVNFPQYCPSLEVKGWSISNLKTHTGSVELYLQCKEVTLTWQKERIKNAASCFSMST